MSDLLRVLSIGVTINCLSQVNYQLLVISGRERVAAYLSMFWLVPSFVVSFAAAHTFGPLGVAWTFALRQLADVFVVKFLVARSEEPGLQGGLPYSLAVAWTAVVIMLIVSGIVLISKWLDSEMPPNPPAKVEKVNDKK